MIVYNTLSGQKEELVPPKRGSLKLFVCGPTIYDYAHIGNARTYAIFDMMVRYLRSQKIKVFYLQNITDIDDKIIHRAAEEKTDWKTVAKKFERAYHEDEKALGIRSVTKYAPATKYIRRIVKQIQALVSKGHAYKIEGEGLYFDISTFPDYGRLSKRTAAQAEDSVSRIDEGVQKRNRGDFALWKFQKHGYEPSWNSSLGAGRPGWHIEDTAITEYYFGPQYDIHGGAIDLKFPHHEAEIAQQESASGKKPLVKLWMHSGFLLVNGEKMSKSLGNFITIRDFLKRYSPAVFRLIVAQHHYRSPLDYNESVAVAAERTLDGLNQFLAKLNFSRGNIRFNLGSYNQKFTEKIEDDFNLPGALSEIFSLTNQINQVKDEIWNLNRADAGDIQRWITDKLAILGIEMADVKIPFKIGFLARRRELCRSNKQFTQSDDLRKQIEGLGYTIEDTPNGPFLWPVKKIA